jgi:hypothetical protein
MLMKLRFFKIADLPIKRQNPHTCQWRLEMNLHWRREERLVIIMQRTS